MEQVFPRGQTTISTPGSPVKQDFRNETSIRSQFPIE